MPWKELNIHNVDNARVKVKTIKTICCEKIFHLKKKEKNTTEFLQHSTSETDEKGSELHPHPGTQRGATQGCRVFSGRVQGLRAHQRVQRVKKSLPPQRHHRTSVT